MGQAQRVKRVKLVNSLDRQKNDALSKRLLLKKIVYHCVAPKLLNFGHWFESNRFLLPIYPLFSWEATSR